VKVGDLVRCNFQPRCGEYDKAKNSYRNPVPILENKLGIIVKKTDYLRSVARFRVLFTHTGYEHTLVQTVLERLSEDR